jgi:hypothetical protein
MRLSAIKTAVVALAGVGAILTGLSPASASPESPHGRSVDDGALRVMYRGESISSERAAGLQRAAEASGREFVQVFDPISANRGLAHAFDSAADADAFGERIKAELRKAPQDRQAANDGSATTMSIASLPAACPDAYNISRLYVHGSCGGDWWVFQLTDNKSTLGSLANVSSSLVTGRTSGCIILIRLYPGVNYTYTEARFYGDPYEAWYHTFNSVQNDNFESGKSTCS